MNILGRVRVKNKNKAESRKQTYIGHVLVSVNPFRDCMLVLREGRRRDSDKKQWVSIPSKFWTPTAARID